MDINTGNIVSNSSNFFKKLKEVGDTKISKDKVNTTKKIKEDFADIKFSDKNLSSKLMENNNRLSKYENELSKLQFVQQKIEVIRPMIENNDFNKANTIIENSVYNNKQLLKDYFTTTENFPKELTKTQELLNTKQNSLDNEFKSIEIASQNILSLFSNNDNNSSVEFTKNINLTATTTKYNLNNKRVIDLIS